ncbi:MULTISPECIES: DUF7446 family protein [Enterococcus]|uniref:Uncharacterized protein n=4 Tax=Enterococcus faecium TaxID=1352 RepID=A0A6S6MI21_ENTFC|nr:MULTISPECIES: hypothetical protein [Enterococcus]HAP4612823.1 hypothetical protein [Enterococcus faecalis]AUH49235.1 hypothetical protein CX663_15960 [Enterococcus faecium]EOG26336.1 hypothetical protein SMG_01355 [Enterococcus faecium EnGen0180]MBW4139232.1 hypothetical protein [Enterococcus faecium]MBY3649454.1 hypothetical protein [Enterococcus faecium]
MAYENLQLVVAEVSGDIYLTKVKDGIMDTNYRRVATDDVLSSSTEWFRKNEESAVHFEGIDGNIHSLFYTKDKEKAKKILDILKGR